MKRRTTCMVLIFAMTTGLIAYRKATHQIPTTPSYWQEVYNGYGAITYDETQGILMLPAQVAKTGETHAALLLIQRTVTHPQKDFTLRLTVTTEQQLRSPTPNPWEVFWLFFNYRQDTTGVLKTNYFLVKPNGIELGIARDGRKQEFLYTKTNPVLKLGLPANWTVKKKGITLTVSIDGTEVLSFSGNLINSPGAIGLYTEDAKVRVQNVSLSS